MSDCICYFVEVSVFMVQTFQTHKHIFILSLSLCFCFSNISPSFSHFILCGFKISLLSYFVEPNKKFHAKPKGPNKHDSSKSNENNKQFYLLYMQNNNKPQKLKDIYLKPHILCRLGDWKFVAWNEPATLQMKAVSCEICSRRFNFFGFVFINFVSIFRRIWKHEEGEFGFKVKWKDLRNPKGMNLTRAEKRVNRFRSKIKKIHSTSTISRIDEIKYERILRNFRLWFV